MAHTTDNARNNDQEVGGPGPATRAWFCKADAGGPVVVVDRMNEGGESEYAGIIRSLGGRPFRFALGGAESIETPHWSEMETTPTEGEVS